jgi:hypothetical protein
MGTTEEVARGVVRAVQGMEVETGAVGATRSMEGEARVVVAMRHAGEVVRVIRRAVRWPGGGRTVNLHNAGGQTAWRRDLTASLYNAVG